MKLKSIRTNEEVEVLSIKDGEYEVKLKDGSIKRLAESTIKRWWKVCKDVVEPEKIDNYQVVKKSKKKDSKKQKGPSNIEIKKSISEEITNYVHSLGLKICKRKEYVGIYTDKKKKVAELKSGHGCIRVAVRPLVYTFLEKNEAKRCKYLNEKARAHFRTTFKIYNVEQLDFAKKLIEMSLNDLEG